MRTRFAWLILTVAVSTPSHAVAALRVVTTTEDFAAIAREIGGERVQIESVFKGGQDPHQLGEYLDEHLDRRHVLEKADLFISAGPTLEGVASSDPLEHVLNGKVHLGGAGYLDASLGCKILGVPGTVSRAEGTIHGLGSPHYWLDPANGAVIARNIAEKLEQLDADNKGNYAAALDRFLSGLNERETKWAQDARPVRGFPVVAYRDSWGSLGEWLGLRVVGTLEPKPGMEPSKARIAEINRLIKTEHVGAVLIAPYLDRKAADRAVQGTGAQVVVLASSVGSETGVATYFDLFDYDLKVVVAAAKAAGYQPNKQE